MMENKIYYTSTYNSPFGRYTLLSDGKNLVGTWLYGQKHYMEGNYLNTIEDNNLEIFNNTKRLLDEYFKGKRQTFENLPLCYCGSDFRKLILDLLQKIPYGKTVSYGYLANEAAKLSGRDKISARAVGAAVGRNPISIIIPCHRVVGADRSLVGYAGGLQTKIKLLTLEGVDITKFHLPNTKGQLISD